jgi:hypothetical protein
MFEINVTIKADKPESYRQALIALLGGAPMADIGGSPAPIVETAAAPADPKPETPAAAPAGKGTSRKQAPATPAPEPEKAPVAPPAPPAPAPEPEKKALTLEEVRAALKKIADKDGAGESKHKAAVKALLKEFGADKLPDIKPEDYEALMAKAKELE